MGLNAKVYAGSSLVQSAAKTRVVRDWKSSEASRRAGVFPSGGMLLRRSRKKKVSFRAVCSESLMETAP